MSIGFDFLSSRKTILDLNSMNLILNPKEKINNQITDNFLEILAKNYTFNDVKLVERELGAPPPSGKQERITFILNSLKIDDCSEDEKCFIENICN